MQFLFTTGLALLLAALTVHFRDIKDILANLLTLWFFSTPIIYSMQMAPEAYRWVLDLNPMTHLAISYQEVLFQFVSKVGYGKNVLQRDPSVLSTLERARRTPRQPSPPRGGGRV